MSGNNDYPRAYPYDDDGLPTDGVTHYPASAQQMQSFAVAREALSQFEVPVLVHSVRPHERLYVASFDGTGNDAYKDPLHKTNVAQMAGQIEAPETGAFRHDLAQRTC